MNVLVTGGAGYVGSAVVEGLVEAGHRVVVIDNLQQGHREAVHPQAEFVLGDIRDRAMLREVVTRDRVDAVMHMAAETVVEYSMTDPRRHFDTNVGGGLVLLGAMLEHGVDRIIFSSTAAVYGEPQRIPIDEDHPTNPINAYGESKLMFEKVLGWYGRAYGLKHVSMRYFNAAGATERVGEDHNPETHLIPNVLRASMDPTKPIRIFGTDYPTPDGTCIRDYVHVADIAAAHILALARLDEISGGAFNLGNSRGHSVLEIVETGRQVTGRDIAVVYGARRAGDPARLLASSRRVTDQLGWRPRFAEPRSMIESAWRWMEHRSGNGS